MRSFEGRDRRFLLLDVSQLVDALEQTVLRKAIDRKFHLAAAR
jgi:hypothetical protein